MTDRTISIRSKSTRPRLPALAAKALTSLGASEAHAAILRRSS